MRKRILLLAIMALMSLALFAPAAFAQDDDNGATAAPLPDTGGPARVALAVGALLLGAGAGVRLIARRRGSRHDDYYRIA